MKKLFILMTFLIFLLPSFLIGGATNYDRLVLGEDNYGQDPHQTADLVGQYDGYLSNETDNAWKIFENDENLIFTFSTNSVALSSDSGVTTFSFGSLIPTFRYLYTVMDGDSVILNPYKSLYLIRAAVGGSKMFTVDSTGDGYFAGDLSVIGGDITGANGNAIDIGEETDGTFVLSRDDAGTVTLTSADNDANAALTIAAGGTGALTLGDAGSTTAITSSDWAIDAVGDMTGIGSITMDGTFTDGTFSVTSGVFTSISKISDGTAYWRSNKLGGFTSVTADSVTDGTFLAISGAFTGVASITDGTASWSSSNLSGFTSISGTTITDGTWSCSAGTMSGIADLGSVTTADINAGTFDGTIGGTTPAAGSFTTINLASSTTNGINATGTFSDHVIDIQPAASMGANKAVYIGTWGSEAEFDDGGGLFRIYGKVGSGGTASANIFVRTLTDNTSPPIGAQFYTDCSAESPGPNTMDGTDFFAVLNDGSYLAAGSSMMQSMRAIWAKVEGHAGATCNGNVATIWVDNQMYCSVAQEEYGIFATTGGTKPDAFVGFETTSSGYSYLFSYDETSYDQDPVGSGNATTGDKDYYLKVDINGTAYGIQLYEL